jgi:hypothetical protein
VRRKFSHFKLKFESEKSKGQPRPLWHNWFSGSDRNGTPTKRQVYKMSGLQNVRSSKRPVAKKHPFIFFTCGWWKSAGSVAAMLAGKVIALFYSLF